MYEAESKSEVIINYFVYNSLWRMQSVSLLNLITQF
jgi:hypothetical protein